MHDKSIADRMYLKTARSLAIFNGEVHPGLVAQMPPDLLEAGREQAEVVLMLAINQSDLEKFFAQALERLGLRNTPLVVLVRLANTRPSRRGINRRSGSTFSRSR